MTALQRPRDRLRDACRPMRTIRSFADRVAAGMATGDLPGNTRLPAGPEASAVGACMHPGDSGHIAVNTRRTPCIR